MPDPWQQEAHEREFLFGDSRYPEHDIIDMEYRGSEEHERPCVHECSGTMFLKATIGALKCDTCGRLAHCNGEPI